MSGIFHVLRLLFETSCYSYSFFVIKFMVLWLLSDHLIWVFPVSSLEWSCYPSISGSSPFSCCNIKGAVNVLPEVFKPNTSSNSLCTTRNPSSRGTRISFSSHVILLHIRILIWSWNMKKLCFFQWRQLARTIFFRISNSCHHLKQFNYFWPAHWDIIWFSSYNC